MKQNKANNIHKVKLISLTYVCIDSFPIDENNMKNIGVMLSHNQFHSFVYISICSDLAVKMFFFLENTILFCAY